jgi:hypothetical protein
VGMLAGARVPFPPGEPEILAVVIPVDQGNVIRIHAQRSFHKVRDKKGVILTVLGIKDLGAHFSFLLWLSLGFLVNF